MAHGQNITQSTIDCTPCTLCVNAFQSTFPDHLSEQNLREHFSKHKRYILKVVVLRGKKGRYGLVTFSSTEVAENVRMGFNGQPLLGCVTRLHRYEVWCNYQTKGNSFTSSKDTAQQPSEGASAVPSMADPDVVCTPSSCIGEQSSTGEAGARYPPGSVIYVKGIHSKLPDTISDEDLAKHFSAFADDIVNASMVRDPQTKHSTGYGIIAFKCSVTAEKAKKKYNGTHLCKKLQLRVTLDNPDSILPLIASPAQAVHRAESIDVPSSANGTGLSEWDPSQESVTDHVPASKPNESLSVHDSSCFASRGDVTDSMDIKPLHDAETLSSTAKTLVVESLSCIIEKDELKDLFGGCGAEVLSCSIQPSSVVLGTCTATVSVVNTPQIERIIKELNEKEAYGLKLSVHSDEKKHSDIRMRVQRRKVSFALFSFISKHSHAQIEAFKRDGGSFDYEEVVGEAVISIPSENAETLFLLQVFNKYTEKTITFKSSKWNQLTRVRDKHTSSLFQKMESKFSLEIDVDVILQVDKHEILFVGTHEGVVMASTWISDQLNREIEVER